MIFFRSFLFWIFLCLSQAAAQTVQIDIAVFDKSTNEPIAGVILRTGETTGKSTDTNGNVRFNWNKNSLFSTKISSIGYQTAALKFVAKSDTSISVFLVQESLQLEEVRVQGEKSSVSNLAVAKTTLDAHDLHLHRGESLGESIRDIAGVELISVGPGASKPVIRGLHSNRIRILNNGVAQEGQQWGGEHAPEIDPFSAAKITVIKGAAGLEFGPGSIGGVVLVEPNEWNFSDKIRSKMDGSAFSNNLMGSSALEIEGKATQNVAYRVQSSFRYAGDATTPDYRITNSAFRENNIEGGIAWRKNSQFIDVTLSRFATELGVYKGAHIGSTEDLINAINRGYPLLETDFSYDIAPPKQDVTHFVFSSRYKNQFSNGSSLTVKYGWQRNQRQEFDGHRRFSDVNALKPAFDLTLSTYSLDAVWNNKPGERFLWKAGVSGVRQHNYREGAYLIPGYRLLGGGGFWVGAWSFGKFQLESGARYDLQQFKIYPVRAQNIEEQSLAFQNASFSVSSLYTFENTGSIGLTIGQSWRPPGINELFSNGVHHGTAQFERGNVSLNNEISRSADVTWKFENEKRHLEASVYVNEMTGFIYSHPLNEPILTIRGAFPSFEFRQTNAVLSGIELLAEERIFDHTILAFSGSFVRGQNVSLNEPLLFMPAPRVQSSIHHEFASASDFRFYLDADWNYVFHQNRFPAGIDYLDPPPAYQLFSITAGMWKPVKNDDLRFSISVQNLLNTRYRDYQSRYRYFIDEPGRNILFRFSIPLV